MNTEESKKAVTGIYSVKQLQQIAMWSAGVMIVAYLLLYFGTQSSDKPDSQHFFWMVVIVFRIYSALICFELARLMRYGKVLWIIQGFLFPAIALLIMGWPSKRKDGILHKPEGEL